MSACLSVYVCPHPCVCVSLTAWAECVCMCVEGKEPLCPPPSHLQPEAQPCLYKFPTTPGSRGQVDGSLETKKLKE